MSTTPFVINPEYTAISILYKNNDFVADRVFPRVPVGKEEFKYKLRTKGDMFTVPDTKVARKGRPNEVESTETEVNDVCIPYGLDYPVPYSDIKNAPPGYDPRAVATQITTNLVALDREIRCATKAFTAGNYAAGNTITLAGATQWSTPSSSTPIIDIMTGIDACIMRPRKMVIGRAAWTKLIQHPTIVQAAGALPSAQVYGIAQRQRIAELFELEDVIVGEGWYNSAKPGQTPTIVRVWGKHCLLFYDEPNLISPEQTTFGFTAQFDTRVAGEILDPNVGIFGGTVVRVAEQVKEVMPANDLGYLIVNAVA